MEYIVVCSGRSMDVEVSDVVWFSGEVNWCYIAGMRGRFAPTWLLSAKSMWLLAVFAQSQRARATLPVRSEGTCRALPMQMPPFTFAELLISYVSLFVYAGCERLLRCYNALMLEAGNGSWLFRRMRRTFSWVANFALQRVSKQMKGVFNWRNTEPREIFKPFRILSSRI